MTSGIVTLQTSGNTYAVTDSSCLSLLRSLNGSQSNFIFFDCSTDPVIQGAFLSFTTPSNTSSVQVQSITSSASSQFDYVQASALWSLAFGSVLVLYFAASGIGEVLKMLKTH